MGNSNCLGFGITGSRVLVNSVSRQCVKYYFTAPGGFGILLAKKLVDELIYDEKGNDVLLVKYLDRLRIASRPC